MAGLSEGFEERVAEVEVYLAFLSVMEVCAQNGPPRLEGAEHPISTQQQKILYSSVYLQLYNLVEATMTRCIDAVAEAAYANGSWRPGDLSESMRKEWVRVIARTHIELTAEHRLVSALAMCGHLVSELPVANFEIEKGGGGNWDDNAIEAFSSRLGCSLQVSPAVYSAAKRKFRDELGPLGLVKRLRNRLAHGSISFSECSENESVANLVDLKTKTIDYMREVVRCFIQYLDRHEFLLPERRPA